MEISDNSRRVIAQSTVVQDAVDGVDAELVRVLRGRAQASRGSALWALRGIWGLIFFGLLLFVGTPYYARIQGADALTRTAEGLSEAVAVYGPHPELPATGGSGPSSLQSEPASDLFGPLLDELAQLERQAREMVRTQSRNTFDAAVQTGRGIDYDAIAARLIGSLFVVFLVRIMLQVYRTERRFAAFYDSRADALTLGALESIGYREAAELMSTDRLQEDEPVSAPYEWLASAVGGSRVHREERR